MWATRHMRRSFLDVVLRSLKSSLRFAMQQYTYQLDAKPKLATKRVLTGDIT